MGTQGRLILTVNFNGQTNRVDHAREMHRGMLSVLHLFQQHEMPATWMMRDPALAKPLCQEIQSRPGQEIGLLADGSWIGAGRNILSRELLRRVEPARIAGIPISTMSVPKLDGNLDLLVRHRISAVEVHGPQLAQSSRRYGIWQISSTERVPGRKGMFNGRLSYRRLIRNCIKSQQTILLSVDGDAVVADESARKVLQSVCAYAAKQPDLQVRGFAELGKELLAVAPATPSRSILRAV